MKTGLIAVCQSRQRPSPKSSIISTCNTGDKGTSPVVCQYKGSWAEQMVCVSLHVCRQLWLHWQAPALSAFHCPQESSECWLPEVRTASLVCRELHALHANLTMSCCVSFQGGLLLKLWQQAMSTEAGRKLGRKLIESLASSQKLELLDLVGI